MGERTYRSIPEVVARGDALDLVQGRVTSANHSDRAGSHAGAVEGREVTRIAQWLKSLDHIGPSSRAIRLDVHEEIQRLSRRSVVDSIPGTIRARTRQVHTRRVLLVQHAQDRLDVQAIERPLGREGGLLVADVQSAVVEPDVCLDAHGADAEGGVEGQRAPVVVVRVEGFGDDALG